MRSILSFVALLAVSALVLADPPTLKDARQRWLRGNYDEARELYQELAKDEKSFTPAVIGVSRAHQSVGEYDKALDVIDTGLKDLPKDADLLARRAELLHLRGRWDDAEKAAAAALEASKDHFLARWVKAQLAWDKADFKTADADFRWFIRTYSDRSEKCMDVKDPDELLLVGQAGVANARWHNLDDQFGFVLNEVYGDALKYEKDFWPAEYHAGMLLLEKYNRGEALPAFENALKINPRAAEVLAGKAAAALQQFEIKDAELFLDQALAINPNLPEALQLRADVLLLAGDFAAALKELEKARKINPRDESTLGRIAASLWLIRKAGEDDLAKLLKEVEAFNPKPGVLYYELGERLEDRRHFEAAEQFYKKSIELRPMLPWAYNSLGILYMRMGREKDARPILDKAFKTLDPFNVRVSNMRKVLKHLDAYETLKTAHYELRFDDNKDRALARYMATALEEIYDDLAGKFNYKPAGPILVEVFNTHEMFSGRVVALPDLHTIGACTGKMVAMASPNAKGIRKPFNWGRVLRHEMVHIFNLEQTDLQVTHWLTEGLAVENEGYPRPQPWNQLLLDRVPKGELLNLDTIDMGFIRPKTPNDWHMAYCQSQIYVQFIEAKFGPKAVAGLLEAYRDGLNTDKAIEKVCGVNKAEFEKGYKAFIEDVVRKMGGRPGEKPLTFRELRDQYEKDPNDHENAARYAEQMMRRDKAEARKIVDAVLEKNGKHPLAVAVKARLLMMAGDLKPARRMLEEVIDRANPEPKVVLELGKLYYENGDAVKAAEMFELGRKVEPYDSQWLEGLARAYALAKDKDKRIAVLKELAPTDADDLETRQQLSRLLLEDGKFAEAEKYARECLEIDIRSDEAREVLFKALAEQKKDAETERMRKVFE